MQMGFATMERLPLALDITYRDSTCAEITERRDAIFC